MGAQKEAGEDGWGAQGGGALWNSALGKKNDHDFTGPSKAEGAWHLGPSPWTPLSCKAPPHPHHSGALGSQLCPLVWVENRGSDKAGLCIPESKEGTVPGGWALNRSSAHSAALWVPRLGLRHLPKDTALQGSLVKTQAPRPHPGQRPGKCGCGQQVPQMVLTPGVQ